MENNIKIVNNTIITHNNLSGKQNIFFIFFRLSNYMLIVKYKSLINYRCVLQNGMISDICFEILRTKNKK